MPDPTPNPQDLSTETPVGAPVPIDADIQQIQSMDMPGRVPATRTGQAWVTLAVAALLAVLLIIFLIQNTGSTRISFLWMSGSTPLAVALLIAAVGSALLALTLGTARIAQLRHQVRKH